MKSLNLEVITEDGTDKVIGILVDDFPDFNHFLIDDIKELVFWKVFDGEDDKILITSFDGWDNYVKEMYLEAMEGIKI